MSGLAEVSIYTMRSNMSLASAVVIFAEGAKAEDLLITQAKSNICVAILMNFP